MTFEIIVKAVKKNWQYLLGAVVGLCVVICGIYFTFWLATGEWKFFMVIDFSLRQTMLWLFSLVGFSLIFGRIITWILSLIWK